VDQKIRDAIFREVAKEPFALTLGMELKELEDGFSAVEMDYDPAF
jgi:acyl-CoA thioesterase